MNYRAAGANSEIEPGTIVDAIEDQAREIASARQDVITQINAHAETRAELAALKAQPSGVVPEWLTSSRTFADRLYAAGWRDHADAQHAGVAGMYDELLAATPSAGSQEQG